jgi:signal transduction histidine kinase
MKNRARRRLLPQRVRTRLTVLYALLFLIAGSALLAVTYGLLASRLPRPSSSAHRASVSRDLLALCKQPTPVGTKRPPDVLIAKCKEAFAAGASAAAKNQRDQTLNSLLVASAIGLGAITLVSGGLGWIISGRALGPVRRITDTARRASELDLRQRLALTGPHDELKELADTFDEMLERLDRAFASQKRFVANAAHELRTPLTAMRTSIEVTLAKPNRSPEQLEAMAAKVQRSIQRAEATVDALLTLATSEQGPTSHEPVDLATATEDALDTASPAIRGHDLTVEATLETAPAIGDPILLERMIANLVDNAARHNTPHGWIRVHTSQNDGTSLFRVANSGPYVAQETIRTLFEPFARAEQRLNPEQGVGLGLSIAHAIAAVHGAVLVAQSRPEGGLDVTVTIPRDGISVTSAGSRGSDPMTPRGRGT